MRLSENQEVRWAWGPVLKRLWTDVGPRDLDHTGPGVMFGPVRELEAVVGPQSLVHSYLAWWVMTLQA